MRTTPNRRGASGPQARTPTFQIVTGGVGGLLCDTGVREDAMTLIFLDARGPHVAVGRDDFPFWPEA